MLEIVQYKGERADYKSRRNAFEEKIHFPASPGTKRLILLIYQAHLSP